MDVLSRCENLLHELKELTQQIQLVEDKLRHIAEYEYEAIEMLLEENFMLALNASGCYESLLASLHELEQEEGMRFHARRLDRELAKLEENIDA